MLWSTAGCAPKPLISVVVLAYNSAAFISECIDSILQSHTTASFEIIVLDNGSVDGTRTVLVDTCGQNTSVSIVRVESGLGYAGGNNYAASFAKGDVLLFLNDDCVLEVDTLDRLRLELDARPDIGILQCALATADGTAWDSLGTNMDGLGFVKILGSGSKREGTPAQTRNIFAAAGAAFAIRRSAFEELGGFDASYMFLFEETDICWRAHLLGYHVGVSTSAIARHRQLARYSVGDNGGAGSALFLFTRNRIRSLLKNFELGTLIWALPIHCLSLLAYALVEICRGRGHNAGDIAYAVLWNLQRARETLAERKRIQRSRRVTDRRLFRMGYIERLSPSSLYSALRRSQG